MGADDGTVMLCLMKTLATAGYQNRTHRIQQIICELLMQPSTIKYI